MPQPIIDSHQHFWDPAAGTCGWMSAAHEPIRRVFGPADLRPALAATAVDRTVLVQTVHTVEETAAFLEIAEATEFVAGVVGWVDLTDPGVGRMIAELKGRPDGRWLVGIRHLVHDEPDPEWLLRDDVQRGLEAVAEAGLAYDLLLRERELPAALRTVARHPRLRFVVDHIAKPRIREHAMEPWTTLMRDFRAHRGHVWCKLSGMVTEADWEAWSPRDLAPYVKEALAVFGAERCLFGSDWPVCLLAADYLRVKAALEYCLADLPTDQLAIVFGGSAAEVYRLAG